MAEIKSTLDLVMEKTRHLKMTQDEKKALDLEQTLKKIPGLVQKYVDGALKDRDFKREVESYQSYDPEVVRKEFAKELARTLTFKDRDRDLRVIDALLMVGFENKDNVINELRNCIETFHSEQKSLIERRISEFLAELEKSGIRGSAVAPKINLGQEDLRNLQAIKATCLNLISRLI